MSAQTGEKRKVDIDPLPMHAAIALAEVKPGKTYATFDGGGGARCHGCSGHLDFSWVAVHVPTRTIVNVCTNCSGK